MPITKCPHADARCSERLHRLWESTLADLYRSGSELRPGTDRTIGIRRGSTIVPFRIVELVCQACDRTLQQRARSGVATGTSTPDLLRLFLTTAVVRQREGAHHGTRVEDRRGVQRPSGSADCRRLGMNRLEGSPDRPKADGGQRRPEQRSG